MKYPRILLFFFLITSPIAHVAHAQLLTQEELKNDLSFLDDLLQKHSSYQRLNGYDYQNDFENFLDQTTSQGIAPEDFGLFLAKTIGKIGDRHASVRGYDLPESLYFPFTFAPFGEKVLVLQYNKDSKMYRPWDESYPYLKAIHHIELEELLPQVLPEEILAPKSSYRLRALRELRDIETVFFKMGRKVPNPIQVTVENENGLEKNIEITLADTKGKAYLWDERFGDGHFFLSEEDYANPAIVHDFFKLDKDIAYIQLTEMLSKEDSPLFFTYLNDFMRNIKDSKALIIDVRNNGGGTRDLIQELAGYLIHPDSIYVVNIAKQRTDGVLNSEQVESLHGRYLVSRDELDSLEKKEVDNFMHTFHPMYRLDEGRYSDYYYYLFNGYKLSQNKYYYNRPVYILANERTFSAASVLVSTLKSLPNVTIVGQTTDGSSGNSMRFELPHSQLRIKLSTMVSFQKDGSILDGIGTKPDLEIPRSLDQVFGTEDHQLQKLKELILHSHPTK